MTKWANEIFPIGKLWLLWQNIRAYWSLFSINCLYFCVCVCETDMKLTETEKNAQRRPRRPQSHICHISWNSITHNHQTEKIKHEYMRAFDVRANSTKMIWREKKRDKRKFMSARKMMRIDLLNAILCSVLSFSYQKVSEWVSVRTCVNSALLSVYWNVLLDLKYDRTKWINVSII